MALIHPLIVWSSIMHHQVEKSIESSGWHGEVIFTFCFIIGCNDRSIEGPGDIEEFIIVWKMEWTGQDNRGAQMHINLCGKCWEAEDRNR